MMFREPIVPVTSTYRLSETFPD